MLTTRRFTDTGNIEVLDEKNVVLAISRNSVLIIYSSTPLEAAIEVAQKYGPRFWSVWYGNWPTWFPGFEAEAEWAC